MTKSYFLSIFLHLIFAAFLFSLAVSPHKALLPGRIDQVFLVASIPAVPSLPSGTGSLRPAESVPAKESPGEPSGAVPVKEEKSLAERLATRLSGVKKDAWTTGKSVLGEGSREKPENEGDLKAGTSGKGGSSAGRPPNQPGQAATSGGGGSALVESEAGFPDGWYLTLLSRRLSERWNPARDGIAVVRREVTVSFTITRDGRIKDINITRASGNPKFDRSGMAAVAESDFLPPLPASWGKGDLQVSVRFREK